MNEFRAQWMKYATGERGIRVFKAMGIVLLAITAFWFLDLPQTVRLKAAIARNLPISSHAANSLINSMCVGAYAGSSNTGAMSCYLAYYDEAGAQAELEKTWACKKVEKDISQNPDNWIALDGESKGYFAYFGPGAKIGQNLFDLRNCNAQ